MLFAALVHRGESTPLSSRQRLVLGGAGVALAAHFATWIASLQYTAVAVSTLLVATSPIWTALYDGVIRRQRLSNRSIGSFALGGVGLILVVGFDRATPPLPGHELFGSALALAGALAFAVYLLLVRTVRASLSTRRIVTHTYTWAAIALIAAAALARQGAPPLQNTTAWGGIVAMALLSQLLGHTGMNAALRWFTPSAISFSTLLEPVFAAALALALFSERVPPLAIIGGVLVLGAVAIVAREEREPAEAAL